MVSKADTLCNTMVVRDGESSRERGSSLSLGDPLIKREVRGRREREEGRNSSSFMSMRTKVCKCERFPIHSGMVRIGFPDKSSCVS